MKYNCDICNKSYCNYELLWKHQKMINNINSIFENLNNNCIYCNKIYNPSHVRFSLDNIIEHNDFISDHEQECKIIFEHAQECKNILDKEKTKNKITELEKKIKLLEKELAKKCSINI